MHCLHDVLQFFETSLKNCIDKNWKYCSKHCIVKQKMRCFKWCLRFQNPTVLGTLKLNKQTRSFKHHELLIYWLMIIDLKRSIDLKRLFDQVLSFSLTWPRYYLLPINQFLIFCYCGYKWWTSENVRAAWQNQPQVLQNLN